MGQLGAFSLCATATIKCEPVRKKFFQHQIFVNTQRRHCVETVVVESLPRYFSPNHLPLFPQKQQKSHCIARLRRPKKEHKHTDGTTTLPSAMASQRPCAERAREEKFALERGNLSPAANMHNLASELDLFPSRFRTQSWK